MLSSTTTPSSNGTLSVLSRPWVTGAVIIATFFVVVFGLMPDADLFWSHCRVAEWGILACIILLFIKNIWLMMFLLWNLGSLIMVSVTAPEQGAAGAFIAFHYIFLFGVFYQILDNILDRKHIRIIINGLCCMALAQTIYITFQHFKLDPYFKAMMGSKGYQSMDVQDLVVGTWGHTNFAGAYLAASIPLFLRKRWVWFIPFLVTAIFWGRSWGAIAACTIGVIFWALFTLKGKSRIAFVLIMITGSLIYVRGFDKQPLNYFKSDRMQYVKPAIELLKIKPFVGWGIGQYKPAMHAIKKNILLPENQRESAKKTHAHFDLYEHIIETGLIGFIPIAGFAVFICLMFLRSRSQLSIVAMSGAVVIFINSCSTFLMRTPMAWIFLIYLIIIIKEAQRKCE